jgi:hypothetical protein
MAVSAMESLYGGGFVVMNFGQAYRKSSSKAGIPSSLDTGYGEQGAEHFKGWLHTHAAFL